METRTTWNPLDPVLVEGEIERQRMAIFAACVPGKDAGVVWAKVQKFLDAAAQRFAAPFGRLWWLDSSRKLDDWLRHHRLSPYGAVGSRLRTLGGLWQSPGWSWRDLDGRPFFGPKTTRFIALYTSPKARVAALDVHVLRWLGSLGHDAPPKPPPAGPAYDRLEGHFLAEADRLGLAPWELDRRVWLAGRNARKCSRQPSAA